MNRIIHPLPALIASATDREPARYVEFLKTENQILRSRVKGQIHTRPHERERLVSLGKKIGRAVEELITIVQASTFSYDLKEKTPQSRQQPKGIKQPYFCQSLSET